MSAQPVIVQQLTEHRLPIFAHTAAAFRREIKEPILNWGTIGEIILKDPGLVLETLQQLMASSRRARSLEVTDMSQAAMLMGVDRVKSLIDGVPIVEETLSEEDAVRFTRAVNRAFHAAFQARNWAQWRNDFAPEEIFTATLLHSIPELALWTSSPKKMQLLRRRIYREGMSADDAQHITLGNSLQHYGRMATSDMHLPSFIHDVLRPENAKLPRVHGVLLAVQLANTVEFGWYTDEVSSIIEEIATFLNKTPDQAASIIHQNAVNAARTSPFQSVRPAATLLAMIPCDKTGLIIEEFPDEPEEGDVQSSSGGATLHVVESEPADSRRGTGSITIEEPTRKSKPVQRVEEAEPEQTSEICLAPQPALFVRAVHELKEGVGRMDVNETIRCAVHGMHDGVGFHRIVFATQPGKQPYLEPQFLIGTDNDPAFNSFKIKLDKLNIFSRLLEKPSSVWVNDENRQKYWQSIPAEFKVLVKVNSFCAMSVHVDSKPVGLFYADRHSPDCKIDKQAFTMFRHLGLLVGKCLSEAPDT